MKVSKSLLGAMLIGLTIGATSCGDELFVINDVDQVDFKKVHSTETEVDTSGPCPSDSDRPNEVYDCMACGMG